MSFKRIVEHRAVVGPMFKDGPEDRFWLHQEGHPEPCVDPPFRVIRMRVTYEEVEPAAPEPKEPQP